MYWYKVFVVDLYFSTPPQVQIVVRGLTSEDSVDAFLRNHVRKSSKRQKKKIVTYADYITHGLRLLLSIFRSYFSVLILEY